MLGDKLGKRWKDLKNQFVDSLAHAIWYEIMDVLVEYQIRCRNDIYGKYNAMARKTTVL